VIVVVGLSHKSAPIAVREQLALPEKDIPDFLRKLVGSDAVGEALIVATCNRVELVAAGRSGNEDLEAVSRACVHALAERSAGAASHLYAHRGPAAVKHLFRVAASLDSLVLGEPQILGQVKDAYEIAREAGTVGPLLHRTLSRAIRSAKRVRSETTIGSGQVSVPSVAVDLARQIFGELSNHHALLVGSGEMAETVARLLVGSGARITVVGRTKEKVDELARSVGGDGRLWPELKASLVEADVVISSTSAQDFVVEYDAVAAARKSRRGRNQFYIDLAVPRDVDPRIEALDGVFLYNVDDLSRVVSESLSSRSREAEAAERIVEAESQNYDRWAGAEAATPTIVALRQRLSGAFRFELERSMRSKLKHLSSDDRQALERMLEAAINRLLHQPTMRLRRAATERDSLDGAGFDQFATMLHELFELGSASEVDQSPGAADAQPEPSREDEPELPKTGGAVR
jgi:glutamyl-tRNA reductase